MDEVIKHKWNISCTEAKRIQISLQSKILQQPLPEKIKLIAAVDVSYTRWDNQGYAVLGLFSVGYDNSGGFANLKEEMIFTRQDSISFPYVPGYLSFREIPLVKPLMRELDIIPDLILVDGAGIAHPRRIGLAAHLGVLFDLPAVGCAKSKLIGEYEEPGIRKGSWSYLTIKGEKVGIVLRSKNKVKPLFVSPGHRCDIRSAYQIVLKFCTGYRLPDPIRRVDALSKQIRLGNRKRGLR